jgi:hypothetical protein
MGARLKEEEGRKRYKGKRVEGQEKRMACGGERE